MGGTKKKRKMRGTKQQQKRGVLRRDKKNPKTTKKKTRKQENKPKRGWKKRAAWRVDFGQKTGQKPSRNRMGNWAIIDYFSGVLRRDKYSRFFDSSFPALLYSRFRLEFFRPVLQALSCGGTKKRQKMGGT